MTGREYQYGFYRLSEGVRDITRRTCVAQKISYALETYIATPLSDSICLDIGCSSGIITTLLASQFKRIIGVDLDVLGLGAISPSHKAQAQFINGDAMTLPFGDGVIDVVICAQIYEHVPSDVVLAKEIYRILKPGGIVFFSGPNWLFPIEPHYHMLFLHWLPANIADYWLRLRGRGLHYYERSRNFWGLRRLWNQFEIQDITVSLIRDYILPNSRYGKWALLELPPFFWRLFLPFFPNFNWILKKSVMDCVE